MHGVMTESFLEPSVIRISCLTVNTCRQQRLNFIHSLKLERQYKNGSGDKGYPKPKRRNIDRVATCKPGEPSCTLLVLDFLKHCEPKSMLELRQSIRIATHRRLRRLQTGESLGSPLRYLEGCCGESIWWTHKSSFERLEQSRGT